MSVYNVSTIILSNCNGVQYSFTVHITDPVKPALIFNTSKKNGKQDYYRLAKLLRLNELPEVHLSLREADSIKSLVRYRKSIGEEIVMLKNRVHSILVRY